MPVQSGRLLFSSRAAIHLNSGSLFKSTSMEEFSGRTQRKTSAGENSVEDFDGKTSMEDLEPCKSFAYRTASQAAGRSTAKREFGKRKVETQTVQTNSLMCAAHCVDRAIYPCVSTCVVLLVCEQALYTCRHAFRRRQLLRSLVHGRRS